jgi:hypothetical protein
MLMNILVGIAAGLAISTFEDSDQGLICPNLGDDTPWQAPRFRNPLNRMCDFSHPCATGTEPAPASVTFGRRVTSKKAMGRYVPAREEMA